MREPRRWGFSVSRSEYFQVSVINIDQVAILDRQDDRQRYEELRDEYELLNGGEPFHLAVLIMWLGRPPTHLSRSRRTTSRAGLSAIRGHIRRVSCFTRLRVGRGGGFARH
jgi:hypothetical protein